MSELTTADFVPFFQKVYQFTPFPWQSRLAQQVCEDGWPACLDLPTASGKTACIDIAVFSMALKRQGPRRIFFVVDRRIVVDAAFDRMNKLASALCSAKEGLLKTIADRLREMAASDTPLDTYQLRGGIYRDDSWVRSPLQPTLIASTVDQTGSRLLFRGYGVWDKTLPIHAALVANDSLIFLDEAHCSQPFSRTVTAVQRYRRNEYAPFHFVELSATPGKQSFQPFRLDDEDQRHPELQRRILAPKTTTLAPSKARLKDLNKLAESLLENALELAAKPGLSRIAIIVNRIRTARLVYQLLLDQKRTARLLIGRMRPIDRLSLAPDLQAMMSGATSRNPDAPPVFVVATQCLEVGADLDFDALVTECASIDALLQRFGRLDRIGALHASGFTAEGRIVIAAPMADPKYVDPIYAGALTKTWQWLNTLGPTLNFAIASADGSTVREQFLRLDPEQAASLLRDEPRAPMLLPSHLDALVQTSPRSALEPDIALFLHGLEKGSPDVQVVWRADLDPTAKDDNWIETVALCPPVSTEAMTVPLYDFRRWLSRSGDEGTLASDIEGIGQELEKSDPEEVSFRVLRWRGDHSDFIEDPNKILPGDTLILSESARGWDQLGHVPDGNSIDVAERARFLLHGWKLRLHPKILETWPQHPARETLIQLATDPDPSMEAIRIALAEYRPTDHPWFSEFLAKLPPRITKEAYPDNTGWLLSGPFTESDSGEDESSTSTQVPLDQHLNDVTTVATQFAEALVPSEHVRASLIRSAQLHDYGKADSRFQALLHGGDPIAAQYAPKLLAKGNQASQSRFIRKQQWERSGLPSGFRHELISLLLARASNDDLTLHLIASHHGRCRPFAPFVADTGPDLHYNGVAISAADRINSAAHRLDSGIADRFWLLTRQHGWWGLAFLESILRLADWQASRTGLLTCPPR